MPDTPASFFRTSPDAHAIHVTAEGSHFQRQRNFSPAGALEPEGICQMGGEGGKAALVGNQNHGTCVICFSRIAAEY